MTDEHREDPELEGGLSRRTFVVSSTALGAAVVWGASFPFANAAIGQRIGASHDVTGATGAGPTGTTTTTTTTSTGTSTTSSTATTTTTATTTGATSASGAPPPAEKPPPTPKRGSLEIIVIDSLISHGKGFVRVNVRWTGAATFHGIAALQAIIGVGRHRRRTDIGRIEITLHSEHRTVIDIPLTPIGLELVAKHASYPVRLVLSGEGASRARMLNLRRGHTA